MRKLLVLLLTACGASFATTASAQPVFVEAESFAPSSDGWKINENPQTRGASSVAALNGATGDLQANAETLLKIPTAGDYRVWVRHNYHARLRGPFRLTVKQAGQRIGEKAFDLIARPEVMDWHYVWDSLDVMLSVGECRLILSKHGDKNCSGYVRNVDCVLLTTDQELTPDHTAHGPQTWLRVKLDDAYRKPLQIHIFADHYRSPWYSHWHLSKVGANPGLRPANDKLLAGGEQTPWCNITPMLYQDSGAILNISARYTYHEWAERLKARFEFATAPKESASVRTMDVNSQPNGLVVVMPPDLTTLENLKRLKRDREFAEATGRLADSFKWPTFGKRPDQIPFFVNATVGGYGTEVDQSVQDREWKTLGYFGFCNREKPFIHGGIWRMKNGSYCSPESMSCRETPPSRPPSFSKAGVGRKRLSSACSRTNRGAAFGFSGEGCILSGSFPKLANGTWQNARRSGSRNLGHGKSSSGARTRRLSPIALLDSAISHAGARRFYSDSAKDSGERLRPCLADCGEL